MNIVGASRSDPQACVPAVMDLPLYCSVPKSSIADLGRTTYQLFGKAVVLTEVCDRMDRTENW